MLFSKDLVQLRTVSAPHLVAAGRRTGETSQSSLGRRRHQASEMNRRRVFVGFWQTVTPTCCTAAT
jgi:hypothetical protein